MRICKYCEPTDDRWFYGKESKVYFACKCQIFRCRHPLRVPPNVPPLDRAGLNSRVRYNEEGEIQKDFIIVRSKYCNTENCKNFTEQEGATK